MLVTPMVSATVDTGALRHNLQIVRRWAPQSRVMAVIKANAYGHGLVAVARALEAADAFAVARVDEGLTLRNSGIGKRTVLLEGVFDREQLDAAAAAGFELVVHTIEQIDLLRAARAGAPRRQSSSATASCWTTTTPTRGRTRASSSFPRRGKE